MIQDTTQTDGMQYKSMYILVNSVTNIQIWKETQPELFWFLENSFNVNVLNISISGEHILLELNIPCINLLSFQESLKDGSLLHKIDSIHGTVKKSRIVKSMTGLALERKLTNISDLESRLIQLEMKERAQSIDIKALVQELSRFQIHFFKKLSELEDKVNLNLGNLEIKTEKLEKILTKYS